ncbi:energy transducer TonB [Edaphobacter bradus]|uniref:energy transducer TonB n=1 Tax=Edaphobacter bradus TaxID=2259016 RepID=UPI0021DFE0DB|nr:energy transducer TonB [Edaphobacter bradus]
MNDQIEFDELLNTVLCEVANPDPMEGLEQRLTRRWSALEVGQDALADSLLLAGGIKEENVVASLWRGLRELIAPDRLPPLVLESREVPVINRMAVERNYSSTAYALGAHAMAILLIGFVVRAQIRETDPVRSVTPLMDAPVLRIVAKAAQQMGGGGGQHGETPVSKGRLPKLEQEQIVPPMQPPKIAPKIAIEPSVVVQKDLKLADNMLPNLGLPNSPIVGASMGDGRGTGIGPGDGPGIGPGTGGNTGGGLRHVGGSVTAPEVLYLVEPEFSEEARKAKVSGDVSVYLWVDEHGKPTHVRVVHGMGLGLDERAIEAVKQYRFKPAMENGKPVTVEMYVVVNFQIF